MKLDPFAGSEKEVDALREAEIYPNNFSEEEFKVSKVQTNSKTGDTPGKHGMVVNALARELRSLTPEVNGYGRMDLCIFEKTNITTVFEVKTNNSSQSLYTAVGQLLMYTHSFKSAKLVLVIPNSPNELDKHQTKRLTELGIRILYYSCAWNGDEPKFKQLKNFV